MEHQDARTHTQACKLVFPHLVRLIVSPSSVNPKEEKMAEPTQDPSLPSPPFVFVPGIPNLRDIGGLPVAGRPGKVIRRGLVYRSSEPSRVTDEGVSVLNSLGVTHVYDLRSAVEIERATRTEGWEPREWPGAERVFVPVFLDQDYSPEALALRFAQYGSSSAEVR